MTPNGHFQCLKYGFYSKISVKLAITYAILALIATAANIGAQDLVIRGYSGTFDVLLSMVVGTGIGLMVEYILDKRYIFCFRARNAVHDGQTFALYTLMGLVDGACDNRYFLGVRVRFQPYLRNERNALPWRRHRASHRLSG